MPPEILVAAIAAAAVLLITVGLATRPGKDAVQARLEQLVVQPKSLEEYELQQPFFVGAGVGFMGPEFWLGRRIRSRAMGMVLQLPDALDLLTISVEAGLGFDAALAKVVEKMEGPLVQEFRQALAEIRMGRSRRDALRDVAKRADAQPINNFIGAIVQAEQLGVPIAKVLQIQSNQLRAQ